jgi:hypothetical protein
LQWPLRRSFSGPLWCENYCRSHVLWDNPTLRNVAGTGGDRSGDLGGHKPFEINSCIAWMQYALKWRKCTAWCALPKHMFFCWDSFRNDLEGNLCMKMSAHIFRHLILWGPKP